MAQKPSIPKGTRDFTPAEMARRNYIFDTIRTVFKLHGFQQIETPAMENLSTLMGKYGEEGDKLLFKILNSGEFLRGVDPQLLDAALAGEGSGSAKLAAKLCEKGLRYDLTVPFARFVVMHRNDLSFPFKRFQIQPVWRADRPQKGRYREFYQCDADIVGSDSLLNEVELISMIDHVFTSLKINTTIKVNNRKVLTGIAEVIGCPEKIVDITVAIDKIDKIGLDNVKAELLEKGLSEAQCDALTPILTLEGDNASKLDRLQEILTPSEDGMKGVGELREVVETSASLGLKAMLEVDISLARGLNYYTGTILEVKARDVAIGSITGGGRYDNLTGVFGMSGLSGVGISFGADRIYDVLNQLDLYPENLTRSVDVLFVNFGKREASAALRCLAELRGWGVAAEIYPDAVKMKKQMGYADTEKIPLVAIIGETELEQSSVVLKNMATGDQQIVAQSELPQTVAAILAK